MSRANSMHRPAWSYVLRVWRMPAFTRPYQDAGLINRDPEYGRIVCFCERVTAGEIRDAYAAAIPPRPWTGCGAGPAP